MIETSEALRAAYLERWYRAEERVAEVARTRAAAQGRPWSEGDPSPRAMIGAAVACLESARAVAARTDLALVPVLDAAMNTFIPLQDGS